jgi:hypothetical protein
MAANYTVPPIIGQLKLNNGRVATFYETDRAGYERALASGATTVGPPPADTTVVDGKQVATTENVLPSADTVTTGESQATGAQPGFNTGIRLPDETGAVSSIQRNPETGELYDARGLQAPTSGGVGAGTSSNSFNSRGSDNNPGPNTAATQQVLAVFSASNVNQLIPTQPNQLDQYASYTYGISWYLLSEEQFAAMVKAQKANVSGWQLLMQSGGAATKGRSPAFPVDYYMDDLEISSKIWGGGKNAANNAVDIRFRVTEPNGITLIQSLFNAVKSVYGATPTTSGTNDTPNYLTAQYCLVIQFYGYDVNGNLVAPAKGTYSTNSSSASGGYGQTAVITKYYPFTLTDIKFTVANKAIEYSIFGKPIPMKYNSSTDRGTIPHDFVMTGQTVNQLLNGKPITVKNTTDPGARKDQPAPVNQAVAASVAIDQANAGVDANGNFTGDTTSPFNVVGA